MAKLLYNTINKKKNNVIKSGIIDLKDEIKKMSKKILEFNRENQLGLGIKILTPNQILGRLPSITLAQLKAGNNSGKLKNEIRQLLYSLYRSKIPTKQLYNSFVDII